MNHKEEYKQKKEEEEEENGIKQSRIIEREKVTT
jgi:hypothetical protein